MSINNSLKNNIITLNLFINYNKNNTNTTVKLHTHLWGGECAMF